MPFYELLEMIRLAGERIVRQTETELYTDKYRYVRSVNANKYTWHRWEATDRFSFIEVD